MSNYTNILQRRKTATKSKTKNSQQQEHHADNSNENCYNKDSHQQEQLEQQPQQNERLQLRTANDKLDAIAHRKQNMKQQQLQRRSTSNSTTPTTTATKTKTLSLCCNGRNGVIPTTAILNCCRDINCRLNAPLRGNIERTSTTATNERRSVSQSSLLDKREKSHSPFSEHLLLRAPTPTSVSTTTTTTTTSSAATSTTQEISSRLSDGNSNVDGNQYFINNEDSDIDKFTVNLNIDLFSWALFILAFCSRFYKLATPAYVVFDELHYGKYISHYMRNIFFFDQHPPLGKQLIAAIVGLAGYDGNFTFPRIGAEYAPNVPIFWLRFLPALCGSLLAPAVYKLLLEARLRRWTALLGGLLVILDNALLTQSRFVLMESILLLFCVLGMCFLLKFQRQRIGSLRWLANGILAAFFLSCAASVKYVGFLSLVLAAYLMCRYLWNLLYDADVSNFQIALHALGRLLLFSAIPLSVYLGVFYVHMYTLHRAGPHDSIMTSAFQASLDGGLASITHGQPLNVVHGSQITLRHTHGRTCWLHSHAHVYPVRYPDKRGSSHQQQVTCYSFKDVNNWWIVKRPDRDDLVVGDEPDVIRHGDVVQMVHGITSRALNSHDVAAPMTPQCQEVSCYIDYDIKMEPELLWRVEILNRNSEGEVWHAIKSEIRLIHETTGAALRYSGRLLPDWAFNQHEIVADREVEHKDTIWNVEEHRYTKSQDQRERERQLLSAEMIPTKKTKLSFWAKFIELQTKMLWNTKQIQNHMYSSEPHEWPLLDKGIAYWLDTSSNAQIFLLGNIMIWYTSTLGLLVYAAFGVFYLLRRRRLCYDLPEAEWQRFQYTGDYFFIGYLIHYLPYYFVDRTLFLHHYLPAFIFKLLLLCYVIEHVDFLLRQHCGDALWLVRGYRLALIIWLLIVGVVYCKFLPLSYGTRKMSSKDVISLRWKDTWDFILQRNYVLN